MLIEPGRIEIDDVREPEVGPDDVRIAVIGVGLCGSDVSVFHGRWKAPEYPWIQGHEAFGTIEGVGDHVAPTRLGETVVLEPNVACGACDQCRRGRTSACPGRQSVGMNRPGAIAEKLVVPSRNAWAVRPRAAADLVCAEPLTVVEAALRRLATPLPGAALVIGVGAQGLLMCVALERRGVRVHAFDVNEERVAFAGTLGAIALAESDAGARFDLVVETSGHPEAVALAVARAEIGGTIVELGLESRPFELSAQTLVRRQLVLRGSLTYDHPGDFRSTVALLDGELVAPGRVVTDEYEFEDAQRAFEQCATARGKSWIRVRSDPA
jgi:alcohol dehydrogenase/L-iditol 2-dehydrogenase